MLTSWIQPQKLNLYCFHLKTPSEFGVHMAIRAVLDLRLQSCRHYLPEGPSGVGQVWVRCPCGGSTGHPNPGSRSSVWLCQHTTPLLLLSRDTVWGLNFVAEQTPKFYCYQTMNKQKNQLQRSENWKDISVKWEDKKKNLIFNNSDFSTQQW